MVEGRKEEDGEKMERKTELIHSSPHKHKSDENEVSSQLQRRFDKKKKKTSKRRRRG